MAYIDTDLLVIKKEDILKHESYTHQEFEPSRFKYTILAENDTKPDFIESVTKS